MKKNCNTYKKLDYLKENHFYWINLYAVIGVLYYKRIFAISVRRKILNSKFFHPEFISFDHSTIELYNFDSDACIAFIFVLSVLTIYLEFQHTNNRTNNLYFKGSAKEYEHIVNKHSLSSSSSYLYFV